jgi:hypothetical protein
MMRGCMKPYGLGPLVFVEGTVDAKKIKNKLKEHVSATLQDLTRYTSEPIFQDDSTPCHRARSVRK